MPALISWPEGVNYEPMDEGWSMPQLYEPQASSDMDAGVPRRGERFTVNFAKQSFSILMSEEEARRFRNWLVKEVRRGTKPFIMPVYFFGEYEERTCWMAPEGPSFTAYGVDKDGKRMYRVQLSISIEDRLNG